MSRAEQKAATRGRLITAAARVFAQRGFGAATVDEIAAAAGLTHGALYAHFGGKEELFLAVYEDYMAERARELAEVAAGPGPLPARARTFADRWMARLSADREAFLLHLEFMVHAARDPALSKRMGLRQSSLRLAVERYLAEEAAEGTEFALPPAELALLTRALGIGLAVEALNDDDAVRGDLFGEFVAQLFTRFATEAQPDSP